MRRIILVLALGALALALSYAIVARWPDRALVAAPDTAAPAADPSH